jgi:hypothetical protein
MSRQRQLVFAVLAPLLLGTVSCHKHSTAGNPKVSGPSQAPTLTQTLPYEIQPQKVPPPPATAKAEEPQQQPQPKKRSRTTARKTTPPPPATTNNSTTNPPAPETSTAELHPPAPPVQAAPLIAIGPDVTSPEARQSTNQLLDTTEGQVKKLEGQSLNSDQHSVLLQIKAYITQSRKAITDGDYERASNLAKKAQLLTEELIKK